MLAPFHIQRSFEDFDEFAEKLEVWDIEIKNLGRQKEKYTINQCSTSDILISAAQFGGKSYQRGNPPPGRTIAFLADHESEISWRNYIINSSSLMIFPLGSELDVITRSAVSGVITISLPEELLIDAFVQKGVQEEWANSTQYEILNIPTIKLDSIRILCTSYLRHLSVHSHLIQSSSFQQAVKESLLTSIVDLFSNKPRTRPNPNKKQKLWEDIKKIINSNDSPPITVQRLSRYLNINERSLQRYFREQHDITPKQFLMMIRLNNVRKSLRQAKKKRSVISSVANAWGFWHMGQFAADYRILFGELPSETLKRQSSMYGPLT